MLPAPCRSVDSRGKVVIEYVEPMTGVRSTVGSPFSARSLLNGNAVLWPSLTVGIIVGVVSFALNATGGSLAVDVALASMATFLFGVLLAFTIAGPGAVTAPPGHHQYEQRRALVHLSDDDRLR